MAEMIANMSDARTKARILNRMRELEGQYRLDVTKYRPRRSDRQNRYYWPSFVSEFAKLLIETGQCDNMAEARQHGHEILKHKFLRREYVDPTTGEVIPYTESTTKLTTAEFNEYLDRCAAWLAELGVIVPESSSYHEREAA